MAPYLAADMTASARNLARATAAAIGHEPAAITVRNVSSLAAQEIAEIGRVFEAELKFAGQPNAEVQLTVSENLTQFVLVAEIHRGADRQVLLESWPRTTAATADAAKNAALVTLDKKLLWEQEEPILDALQSGDTTLVLDASRVLMVRGAERQSAPIPETHPWPRDLRGHLSASSAAFTAWLPGTVCQGSWQPELSLMCHDRQDAWAPTQGATAAFAADRNLFAGHIDLQPGGGHDVAPFYSAASAGGAWLFAAEDGRVHVYTNTWQAAGAIDQWGSDLVEMDTPCGARILATRASSMAEADAVQSYEISGSAANAAGPALEFSGPITALWSSGNAATAVTRDLQTGRYAAYGLAPHCGS